MIKKIHYPASEWTLSIELQGLTEIERMSHKILREAESFKKRNAIAVVACKLDSRKKVYKCCPNCLKAHLIKKAEEWDLGRDLVEIIDNTVEHETGHYGYYMDKDKIVKL